MSENVSERIPQRSEVAPEHKWSIEDIYATDAAWEEDFAKAKGFAERIASYKGQLCESAEKLYEYLLADDEMTVTLEALVNYAQRKNDEDTRKAEYQDMVSRLEMLFVEIGGASAFVTPEILSITDERMEQFYKACPAMELYRLSLDRVRRRREHILSEAEERIMALTGEMAAAPDNIFSMFNDADLKFPDAVDKDGNPHQVTHGSYIPLVKSADRVLRKSAFESLYHVYEGFKNTSAAVLSSQIKTLVFRARARKYDSTLQAALDGNEVPVSVYEQLINAVHENMEPMYRYVRLRKKLLGVDELHAYDLYTPIVSDIDVKVPFEQAKQEVFDSLAPMGEEYRAIFTEGINNRWIDVYENEGKRSGGYSAGCRVH
ncbi:MAG: M3 family oligoendopeptidase, partial [Oscillospiraceae bacterium]